MVEIDASHFKGLESGATQETCFHFKYPIAHISDDLRLCSNCGKELE